MAIASAVQRGSSVYIYNEKGQLLSTAPAGSGPQDGLVGFTGSSVSVRRGTSVYLFNERGQMTGSVPAR